MRTLTLAVLKVLRLEEDDTRAYPFLGEHVCVVYANG